MEKISSFQGIQGLYQLTKEGDIGFYLPNLEFEIDSQKTQYFKKYIGILLEQYSNSSSNSEKLKLGTLVSNNKDKGDSWSSSSTFLLEKRILGDINSHYNKKNLNQRKSIYQAIDDLLQVYDIKVHGKEVPKYLPVLFESNKNNNFIFLNFLEFLNTNSRINQNVLELTNGLRDRVIKKKLKSCYDLSLVEIDKNPIDEYGRDSSGGIFLGR